jgi:TetR/AcrR family transcriptional regulator, cholesterol catabolism regulator
MMSTPFFSSVVPEDPEPMLRQFLEALPGEEDSEAAPSSTRERILDAAVETFAARGFRSTTMRDLATAVGIKAPGLYAHFASKEEILSRAMLRALKRFFTYMSASTQSGTARGMLEQTVRRHVCYQLENLRATRANDLLLASDALRDVLPQGDYDRVRLVQRSYFLLVQSRIEAALPPGSGVDAAMTTHALIAMCNLVTSWYQADSGMKVEDVADYYWFLAAGMLRLHDGDPIA